MLSTGLVAAVIFAVLANLVVWQYLPCIRDLKTALRQSGTKSREFNPIVRVILCLRGADPFLDRCLNGLVNQDYPDYKVLIVVDSPNDDSLPQVKKILAEYGESRVTMLIRDRVLPHCSRRASSLFCGLHHVPDETDVVVMCDADAIPHSTWLRELVAPLQDPMTVATSGNRWYAPIVLTMGGACRYYWNALAFRAMHRYEIPWCGSLAMRRDLFRDSKFLNCLQHAFSEDTALAGFLKNKPQRVMPIVSLVMLNEETIELNRFWGFLVRQMLAARLHHPHWPVILTEALVIFVVMWILLPISIFQGSSSLMWWCIGGAAYDLSVLTTVGYFESLLRKYLWQTRRQRATPVSWIRLLFAPIGLTVTGFLYPLAVIVTAAAKQHVWRGVVYRIESHGVTTLQERQEAATIPMGRYESV